jgi:hypothetical protein
MSPISYLPEIIVQEEPLYVDSNSASTIFSRESYGLSLSREQPSFLTTYSIYSIMYILLESLLKQPGFQSSSASKFAKIKTFSLLIDIERKTIKCKTINAIPK